jgi:hypothetical protein
MKLLTKEIADKIPRLYKTENVPLPEKIAYTKFFYPANQWTWYAVEFDGKDTLWGLVVGHETECGYFSLNELREFVGSTTLGIERDMYFSPTKIQDLLADSNEVMA